MNILFVVPFFPPDKTVGTVRIASLVRYLINNGNSIFIMTNYKDIKEDSIDISNYYYVGNRIEDVSYDFNYMERLYCKTFESIKEKTLFDIIVISGGPFYTFKLAALAKKYEIPCVLDFRDPWVLDKREVIGLRGIKRRIEKKLDSPKEHKAIASASAIVTVTDGWVRMFSQKYSKRKDSFYLIENGFDDVLLQRLDIKRSLNYINDQSLTLGTFGKLFYYSKKYTEIFLKAIKILDDKSFACHVLQIGNREKNTDDLLRKNNIPLNRIESTGFVDYKLGIKTLFSTDIFLIIDDRPDAVGTKIYDYIFLNKPILYVGPKESAIANQVKSFENGYISSSIEEVVYSLEKIVRENITTLYDESVVDKYSFSRSVQNKKWLELLQLFRKKI